MINGNRRTALSMGLRLGMAAALAPTLAARPASAFVPDRLIAPPGGEMRYARTATRTLGDGAQITVSRLFAVNFREFAGGFMLHGRQLSAEVEAPGALARFAEIERARDESGIFPIALDAYGQILEAEVALPAGDEVHRAIEGALRELAVQPIDNAQRDELARFVSAMHTVGQRVTALMPADLFAPAATPRSEEQRVALPGGGEGVVATTFAGQRDRATGLMNDARRCVTTSVAGSQRRTCEQWSLGTS